MTPRRIRHVGATALTALTALVVSTTGLAQPATAASSTGTVKGVVTLQGKPVSFAKVQVYRTVKDPESNEVLVDPTRLKTDNTDSRGRYSLSGLRARAGYVYTVVVTDRPGKIVKAARLVSPRNGRTVTKNVRVQRAAALRGVVTTSDGRSPAGLTVAVDAGFCESDCSRPYQVFYVDEDTTVRADGTFTLAGLPAATYGHVRVSDDRFEPQCYDLPGGTLADCDATQRQRQQVTLAAGEVRTLPTVTKTTFGPPATKVTGLVTDTSGRPLKGIEVRVDGASSAATTRSSGRFTAQERLRAGTHTVSFDDPDRVWAPQYLGGSEDLSGSRTIDITPGQPVAGVGATLKSTARVSVTKKPGRGSATVSFRIRRTATGSAPGGTVTVSLGSVSRTVSVTKGRATVTLRGLPRGLRSLQATYSGTSSTAGQQTTVRLRVR